MQVEIWCEKDALAGVMWDPASAYDVPLMVSRGMPSITFLHGTALEIAGAARAGKRFYVRDVMFLLPSENLRQHLGFAPCTSPAHAAKS